MKGKFNWRSFMAVPFLLGLFFIAGLSSVKAVTLYGVTTNNQLISFDSATPGTITTTRPITGLGAGETILGIDFRPSNGQLYALGSLSRLFTINLTTGAATQVGSSGAFALEGTSFGFDFNPVPDLIRVVSNTGQNLRLDPNTGALTSQDPDLNPRMPNVTGAAYTNSVAGATSTVLYVIDTFSDTLNQQNPANAGTIIPIGFLGVDASDVNGFDIGRGNAAFAALTVIPGGSSLYSIDLATGRATLIGNIGNGSTSLTGLSILISTTGGGGTPTPTPTPTPGGGGTPTPTPTPTVSPTPGGTPRPNLGTRALDFNGDGRADYSVFRAAINTFFIALDPTNASRNFRGVQFGLAATDIIAPGDYDGDGKADVAVFRTTTGTFFVLRSSNNSFQAFQFGANGDEPVQRDYDGDGKTDFAVVRKIGANLVWFINNSRDGSFRAEQFGLSATDVVAPGDYDGDGRYDLAVFRRSGADLNGPATFFVLRSSDRGLTVVPFGLGSDLVVPGDYDGDGRFDFAVVRQGTPYTWFILNSRDNSFRAVQFGTKPDLPTQGDYDGDGKTDISVYRPTLGTFFTLRSTNNTVEIVQFGVNGDFPIADYDTH